MNRFRATGLSIAMAALAACSKETPANSAAVTPADGATTQEAPTAASNGNFEADLATYDLSMDKMQRYAKASKELMAISEADPSIGQTIDMGEGSDFNSVARQMDNHPRIGRALSNAGLSGREFMMIQLAYMQAATGLALSEGNVKGPAVPGVNMKNVEFLRANKARIDSLVREAGMTR